VLTSSTSVVTQLAPNYYDYFVFGGTAGGVTDANVFFAVSPSALFARKTGSLSGTRIPISYTACTFGADESGGAGGAGLVVWCDGV
jgi:hypothetical protein